MRGIPFSCSVTGNFAESFPVLQEVEGIAKGGALGGFALEGLWKLGRTIMTACMV